MADKHIISTLERACLEVEARIQEYRSLLAQCERDLMHLRATIEYWERSEGSTTSRIPSTSVARVFRRGELFAVCERALKPAGRPMTTAELAEVCMKAKAELDIDNRAQRRAMMQLLVEVLTMRWKNGELTSPGLQGKTRLWATT